VRRYRFSKELIHPEIEVVPEPSAPLSSPSSALGRVVPIYSAPEGMNPRTLRRLIGQAVDAYADLVQGHLPADMVRERGLPPVPVALRALHRPETEIDVDRYEAFASPAHERLVLEELYLLALGLAMRRA
jgi:ATP-dependent DNA helicase RecG